jgi:hypothetical protein
MSVEGVVASSAILEILLCYTSPIPTFLQPVSLIPWYSSTAAALQFRECVRMSFVLTRVMAQPGMGHFHTSGVVESVQSRSLWSKIDRIAHHLDLSFYTLSD